MSAIVKVGVSEDKRRFCVEILCRTMDGMARVTLFSDSFGGDVARVVANQLKQSISQEVLATRQRAYELGLHDGRNHARKINTFSDKLDYCAPTGWDDDGTERW